MAKGKLRRNSIDWTPERMSILWERGDKNMTAKKLGMTVSQLGYYRNKFRAQRPDSSRIRNSRKQAASNTGDVVGILTQEVAKSLIGTKGFTMSVNGNSYTFQSQPRVIRMGDMEIEF